MSDQNQDSQTITPQQVSEHEQARHNTPHPAPVTSLQQVYQHRHMSVVEKLEWFETSHLGHPRVKDVVAQFNDFVAEIMELVPHDSPQLTIGLQHLIEAKDAIGRAATVRR